MSASVDLAPPPTILKPPLKWAGGKRWLVPYLRPLWEAYQDRRYVEPFCGGLAVPLGLSPQNAVLNDMNAHVVQFYQWIQRGLTLNIDAFNDSDLYYRHREAFNDLIRAERHETAEAAQLFYYLNRTGYNGLCRFNKRGEYNVPFGKYKTINYMSDFSPYQTSLQRWSFTQGDFQDVSLKPDDFIYADPPYDVQFVQYSKYGFSWDDQVRLAEWLAQHTGPVIISNQKTDRIVELYEHLGYTLFCFKAPRRISCNGNRVPAIEVLAVRNIDDDVLKRMDAQA